MANGTKSLVEEFKEKGKARLKELKDQIGPLVTERDELEEMLSPQAVAPPAPAAPAPKATSKADDTKPTRQRKGGRREDEFVALVAAKPGINVSDAAKELDIKPNYLFRVAAQAVERGRIKKEGKVYQPA